MAYYQFTDPEDPAAESWGSCEVFYVDYNEALMYSQTNQSFCTSPGFYWWPCHPGCLPDGEPVGPFDTEAEAMADAGVAA